MVRDDNLEACAVNYRPFPLARINAAIFIRLYRVVILYAFRDGTSPLPLYIQAGITFFMRFYY